MCFGLKDRAIPFTLAAGLSRLHRALAGLLQEMEKDKGGPQQQPHQTSGHSAYGNRFNPLQKLMLDLALAEDGPLIRDLDPSRSEDAAWNFRYDWFTSGEDIRFSHVNVSEHFLHGHRGASLKSLIEELVENPRKSRNIPALVAVKLPNGMKYVICGNRRLKCFKAAFSRTQTPCDFKMIVHQWPSCDRITDPVQRLVFKLKAIQAMSTVNDGTDVYVGRKRKGDR